MLNFEVKQYSVATVKQGLKNAGMRSQLHERIRAARRFGKLTQERLAEKLEISKAAVAQWEAADSDKRTTPTRENLIGIHRHTGAPLDWLVDDTRGLEEDWLLMGYLPPKTAASSVQEARSDYEVSTPTPSVAELIAKIQHLGLTTSDRAWLAKALDMIEHNTGATLGTPISPDQPLRRPRPKKHTGS